MSGSVVLALRILTALALYGFLGWVLVFLYREVQRQGIVLANRRVPGISIMVTPKNGQGPLRYFHQAEVVTQAVISPYLKTPYQQDMHI